MAIVGVDNSSRGHLKAQVGWLGLRINICLALFHILQVNSTLKWKP